MPGHQLMSDVWNATGDTTPTSVYAASHHWNTTNTDSDIYWDCGFEELAKCVGKITGIIHIILMIIFFNCKIQMNEGMNHDTLQGGGGTYIDCHANKDKTHPQ